MEYLEIFLSFLSILFLFCYCFRNKNGNPTNWPLIGMLPALLKNQHRIQELLCELVGELQFTFIFKGPWFTNLKFLVTADPVNVDHVLIKRFKNYIKGPKMKEMFEVFGDGILTTDSQSWQFHRKVVQLFFAYPEFQKTLANKTWEKIEVGLFPILDHATNHGMEIDLQDLFERFAFDAFCIVTVDHDPRTLHVELPNHPSSKSLNDIPKVVWNRHVVPKFIWNIQRWLNVGCERKYKEAWENLDAFMYGFISTRKNELSKMSIPKESELRNEKRVDFMSFIMDKFEQGNDVKFLRDTLLNLIFAGRDTTSVALSWFFYLITKNPHTLSKIKEELDANIMPPKDDHDKNKSMNHLSRNFDMAKDKLIYLHGALCEALRLYPSVPCETKISTKLDILPSGHKVEPGMQVIISVYAMGRMKSLWGDDCCEFKPERWIDDRGMIKQEPSCKFMAFNAGPRYCVGKNIAFNQMKAIAAAIISNYRFQLLQEHPVVPDTSIILRMKHGLKVKVFTSQ